MDVKAGLWMPNITGMAPETHLVWAVSTSNNLTVNFRLYLSIEDTVGRQCNDL